jgi:predicted nucleotide-binding protein (sugar kinase/HSP70/actin superfamily)
MLPTVSEWIFYTNFTSKRNTFKRREYGDFFRTITNNFFQHKDEKKLENIIVGDLRAGHEASIEEIIKKAEGYIHDSFEGEAVLSVGKALDYIAHGVSGLVNAMPFSCMPGTVVNAMLKKLREDNGNIPYLNMVYEGSESANTITRMEAFVHQTHDFNGRADERSKKASVIDKAAG